jgi:hypothetical protein
VSEMPRPMNCRDCGRPLTDGVSRRFGIGPDCRSGMSGEELRTAAALVKEMAQPGYIPPAKPVSMEARWTNADARATVEAAAARNVCERHGGLAGACPLCRQEEDPAYGVARVIAEIQAERLAARDAAYTAAKTARVRTLHPPVQLALGETA